MTVYELIQRLQAMPPTAEVIIQSPEDEEYHKPLRDLDMGTYSHHFEYADMVFYLPDAKASTDEVAAFMHEYGLSMDDYIHLKRLPRCVVLYPLQ